MAQIGKQTAERLSRGFKDFAFQWPSWEWLPDKLRAAGLEPTALKELRTGDPRSSWLALARPTEALVNHFDLAPEVLVLCAPWGEMRANDIRAAEQCFREETRLDPGFALVITGDENAETRMGAVMPEDRRYLFLSGQKLKDTRDPQGMLRGMLRDALGRRRLFDMRNPASGRQFFGREKELEALERDVLLGSCLGLFGLRKVGKTSLLRRAAEKFRGAGNVVPIEADLQTLHFRRRNIDGLGELVARALEKELSGSKINLRGAPPDSFERIERAIADVHRQRGARLLLILDEYEVLLDGRIPVLDGIEFLTWLRGLAQSHASSFGFILAGRNERLLTPARVNGRDNPMYRFLKTVRIAGLTESECRSMVSKIGRRMALSFQPDALQILVDQTGGHPALARTLGNLVDEAIPISRRDPNPAPVDAIFMQQISPRFGRDKGVSEDMKELVEAGKDIDEDAESYLVRLAYAGAKAASTSEASLHDALIDYGILARDGTAFRIGHLATWLRENYSNPLQVVNG